MNFKMYSFQDSVSPIMEEFIIFYDALNAVMIFILFLVLIAMYKIKSNNFFSASYLHNNMLEWVWTIIPGLILVFVSLPSMLLLYMYDEFSSFAISIKCVGAEWYWIYEYPTIMKMDLIESYMLPSMSHYNIYLLDTSNNLILPNMSSIQMLITSNDVLHSWTLPSMGLKIDAVPGRMNQMNFYSYNLGIYYGQCSEICGSNHSMMPISLEIIPLDKFSSWSFNNMN